MALVHDWLVGMRGGERVLEALCELYPQADLYTLVHRPGACSETIERRTIRTSFIDRLPFAHSHHRRFLPLFPHAIESFDLRSYDLVLSSSHCVAKGVITAPRALHISYVHTPMRYVWEQSPDYFGPGRAGRATRGAAWAVAPFLRLWDESTAHRVDHFIANSAHVADRIRKRYRRDAEVIPPPVELERFTPGEGGSDYLMVTAFAPYKNVELAIEAFRRLGRPLRIVGSGQEAQRIAALVRNVPNVTLLGARSDAEVAALYRACRAFIFPGEEDAGITPLEAQASGRPVIALRRGGATETVVDGETGLFFDEPTVESLMGAVERFEARAPFSPEAARAQAERFSKARFKARIAEVIAERLGRGVASCR